VVTIEGIMESLVALLGVVIAFAVVAADIYVRVMRAHKG
jgi:hypothetical protein